MTQRNMARGCFLWCSSLAYAGSGGETDMKCTEPELVWIILLDAVMFVVFVSFVNYIIGFDFFSDLNKYSLLCLIFIYKI